MLTIQAVSPLEVESNPNRIAMSSVIESVNEQLFKHYDKQSRSAVIKSEKMFKIFKKVGNIPPEANADYLDQVFEVFRHAGWKINGKCYKQDTEPDVYIFEPDHGSL